MRVLAVTLLAVGTLGSASAAPPPEPERPSSIFGLGAQVEFLAPPGGVSGVLLAYDGPHFQLEGSFSIGIFEESDQADIYTGGVRVYFPVHRTARSDFALGGGGGLTLLDEADHDPELAGTFVAGARIRIFVVANACISGTLGLGTVVRAGHGLFLVAARPLGSAGFIYYFF